MAFEQPAWLAGLLLAVLPWCWHGQRRLRWASLAAWPADPLSRVVGLVLRLSASVAVAAASASLAGAYTQGRPIERTGTGAHIVVLLDRSASMADGFAGNAAASEGGDAAESKGHAAARLLDAFVQQRPRDLFGLVFFSTAPMQVLGLTQDHLAVRAAIAASRWMGVGLTNISAGLAMALAPFSDQPRTGSRVVLLVSDGAAGIDPRSQVRLRQRFQQDQVQLYWIYLRSPGGHSPTQTATEAPGADVAPESLLHAFFQDLGVPYRLYEADNPQALAAAIDDVARLQNLPLRYLEAQPRRELGPWLDALSLCGALVWLLARSVEVAAW